MATKREKNFSRSYDDKAGTFEIGHGDETVASFDPAKAHKSMQLKALSRIFADIVVGSGNAAMKAEGGTVEKAQAKMAETIKALTDGTFTFRAASGQASLSLEDEQRIIAETLVSMGKVKDGADGKPAQEVALAKVVALYGKTKTASNGNITRPDYNALRNIPKIKEALDAAAPASDTDEKLEALGFSDEAEGEAVSA